MKNIGRIIALLLICWILPQITLACNTIKENKFINETNNPVKQPQAIDSLMLLISRLDFNKLGIDYSINDKIDKHKLANDVLKYFKTRTSIKHLGYYENTTASKKDIEIADDALEHKFVGQPVYQRFFCGDDINWNTRPVPDNEWVWQLNRMPSWHSMCRVYLDIGDEKYAKEWAYQLKDWVRKNPNDTSHKYAWRSIEAGLRGSGWTNLYFGFINSPFFTSDVLVSFLNSLHDHASYLMTEYTKGSNWALMEANGLIHISTIFPEFKDADIWQKEGVVRFNKEINGQVLPDGHQNELAMGYHLGALSNFLRPYELLYINGISDAFPSSYLETIEKMAEVPMKLTHPDGTIAQFGDAWTGSPGQHNSKFLKWGEFFNREDFIYLGSEGEKGTKPKQTAFSLPHSGLYSMRSGWDKDAINLVLKCGPDGGWHSHPDNGTFELYAGGRILMPDAGAYIYSGDNEGRAWFNQTMVHQTLTLNNKNSIYAPELLKWETSDNLDVLVVQNNSYNNLVHRRAVFFVDKKYFIVMDEAEGSATGDIDIHFQLAPSDPIVNKKDFSFDTDFKDGWNLFVKTEKQVGLDLIEEEGWVSYVYTIKEPRPAFAFKKKKASSSEKVHFTTLVLPYLSEKPDITIKVLKNDMLSSVKLQINDGKTTKEIGYTL